MKKTVSGLFDTPDTAHTAEERLINCGIDKSALHLEAHEATHGNCGHTKHAQQGGIAVGFQHVLAELLGTAPPEGAGACAGQDHHEEFVLAVDVPEDVSLKPVCEALLEAGALDVHEQIAQ